MIKLEPFSDEAPDQSKDFIKLNVTKLQFDKSPKLDEVTDSCLLHIMSFLDLMDTLHLGETCMHIKSVARRSCKRFSHFTFGESTNLSDMRLVLEEIGDSVRSIEIHRLNITILDCLSEFCPNVTRIKLINSSNIFNSISFSKYKSFFRNLTSLEIRKGGLSFNGMSRVNRFQNFDKLLIALTECDTLESLKIEYIEISPQTFDHLKSLKNLKCLHLDRYQRTAPLPPFIPTFQRLNEILLRVEDSKTSELLSELILTGENGIEF